MYNALAAAACALILGVELDAIKRGLEAVVSVPGRVEMLPTKTPYRMIWITAIRRTRWRTF